MPNGKKLLATAWLVAIAVVVILGTTLKQDSDHFFGITDNREHAISFPHPVEILQALVVEGQDAKPGALMLRLSRPDLQARIAVIEHQITELVAHHQETTVTMEGRINALAQEKKVRTAALDTEIAELRKRYSLNLDLLSSISGYDVGSAASQSSPLLAKLVGLQQERRHVIDAVQSQIDTLRQRIEAADAPDQAQIAELETQLAELSRQEGNLTVTANYQARVGSVLFRPGDQLPAFQPIITLHSLAPELVKGYIHEGVYNIVSVGQKVWLRSLGSTQPEPIQGTIEGLGTRIVAYPERLLKNPGVAAWGREVVVRLDRRNPLLLGERVIIALDKPVSLEQRISALFRDGVEQGIRIATAVADSTGNKVGEILDGLVPTTEAATASPTGKSHLLVKP